MSEENPDNEFVFVACAPKCGCVALIVVDNPKREKDFIPDLIDCMRMGCEVARMTLTDYREKLCQNLKLCPNKKSIGMAECIKAHSA